MFGSPISLEGLFNPFKEKKYFLTFLISLSSGSQSKWASRPNVSITWEFVRNTHPHTPYPQPTESETLRVQLRNPCFHMPAVDSYAY